MIQVKLRENSISMNGHAGCSINGQDIVCSAVSALTNNLINSLRDLTGDMILADTGSGRAEIAWNHLSDGGKLLIDSWFLGLVDIDREYNCIIFV